MTGHAFRIHLVKSNNEIGKIVDLAKAIWIDHYSPIVGVEQVTYMLDNFHSRDIIEDEITDKGFNYFLLRNEGMDAGYLSFKINADSLFLSKIYILASQREQGLGKLALGFVRDQAIRENVSRIKLTVDKKNMNSIAAYEKIGFRKTGEIKEDIGSGFILDDYTMEWEI